jgi:hypothetical protein
MTEDKIALRTFMEKGADATFQREMIGFLAQRSPPISFPDSTLTR